MRLSVIIGSQGAPEQVDECLAALERQGGGHALEIIVVDGSAEGADRAACGRLARARLIRSPRARYMPELWARGIAASTGEVVALTTAEFIPREDWVESIVLAHRAPYAGIGGAVENSPAADLVGWAIYFCRYSQYMLPLAAREVADFAGDNGSYKRRALEACREAWREGFWEPFVHAELIKQGGELLLTPEIVVDHRASGGARAFIRQRFWHGRQFGSGRVAVMPAWRRLIYLLLSPLTPAALLWRIARRVLARRRHVGKLLLASPILFVFLLGWAAGEASGYLRPRRRGRPHA